jgi:hypothetical protein
MKRLGTSLAVVGVAASMLSAPAAQASKCPPGSHDPEYCEHDGGGDRGEDRRDHGRDESSEHHRKHHHSGKHNGVSVHVSRKPGASPA